VYNSKMIQIIAFTAFATLATLFPAAVHAQYYEAPWSTPAQYEYQYTQAEGIIPPSYYDYDFAPVDTSGYYMNDYLSGGVYGADAYYGASQYTGDMFDTSPATYAQQYYAPAQQGSSYAQQAAFVQSVQPRVQDYDSVAAAKVLNCAPGDVRWRADELGRPEYYIDGSAKNSTTTSIVAPSCRLSPTATGTGTVILQWATNNATTAFIDNGIGHVSLGTAGRMVTPNVSTVYTMTVVNERGSAAQCAANVIVKGTAPVGTKTVTIDQQGIQQLYDVNGKPIATQGSVAATGTATSGVSAAGTAQVTDAIPTTGTTAGTVVTYDANGNPVQAVAAEANKVGTNILSQITSTLGGGASVWERIRVVSMIALGIFIVLAIVVFVMKKMFGGGGEGAH
jgi:hypothetical protein